MYYKVLACKIEITTLGYSYLPFLKIYILSIVINKTYFSYDQTEIDEEGFIYCMCGGGTKLSNCRFRCKSKTHGAEHVTYMKENEEEVVSQLKSFDGQTILLLGETGVGKSTFINALANYMEYQTWVS